MREHHTLATDRGDIHYWTLRTEKTRPWLIFLPGLSADHHLFDAQLAELARDHQCLVWDPPAHAASRPFALRFTLEDQARWLHAILRREGIPRAVLVGQSMGGFVAQAYAHAYPDEVASIVAIDSAPLTRSYYSAPTLFLLRHTDWMYRPLPWRMLIKVSACGCAETPRGRAYMARTIASYDKKSYCRLVSHGFRQFADAVANGHYTEPSCPVLLLCGRRDHAGSIRRYNRAWTRRAGHPLRWLKNAGHNANVDAPQLANDAICRFILRLS